MKRFPALAVCTLLVLGACSSEPSHIESDEDTETSSSLSSESSELEKDSQKSTVMDAIIEMHFDVPANWKKSEPQLDGPYATITLTSPNYRVTETGGMCDETEGAQIVVTTINIKEKVVAIDDISRQSEDSISKFKKVVVDNHPAVEYVWSWECSPRFITETDYNGIRYSIYLSEADKLSEYSGEYYGVIESIKFATDTNS